MRHPTKVGAFCSRKLARGASVNVVGRGGPSHWRRFSKVVGKPATNQKVRSIFDPRRQ